MTVRNTTIRNAIKIPELVGNFPALFLKSGFAFAMLRVLLAVSCIGLVRLSHTPYCWPTFVVSFVPLVALWRGPLAPRTFVQLLVESILIGFVMEWMVTRFVASAAVSKQEILMHSIGCLLFSLQIVACGITLNKTRHWNTILSAPLVALVMVIVERCEAGLTGVTWVLSNPQLAIGATPIAQWSSLLTPLGISFAVYTINFFWLPCFATPGKKYWAGTAFGFFSTILLWFGGMILETMVVVKPLPFVVAVVQPHGTNGEHSWKQLNRLTVRNIENSGPVDLVVWPEGALDGGSYNDCSNQFVTALAIDQGEAMPLDRFRADLQPKYQASCLVGADMSRHLTNYDHQSSESLRVYNCGCLVEATGEFRCHEKQMLVPMREGIPNWLSHPLPLNWLKAVFDWSPTCALTNWLQVTYEKSKACIYLS